MVLLEAEFNDEVTVECKCLWERAGEEDGKTGETIRRLPHHLNITCTGIMRLPALRLTRFNTGCYMFVVLLFFRFAYTMPE